MEEKKNHDGDMAFFMGWLIETKDELGQVSCLVPCSARHSENEVKTMIHSYGQLVHMRSVAEKLHRDSNSQLRATFERNRTSSACQKEMNIEQFVAMTVLALRGEEPLSIID